MMTSTIRKFGVGVASIALVAGAVAPALAVEKPIPLNGGWDRVASDRVNNDRIDTAIAVAQFHYPDNDDTNPPAKAQAVYIANAAAMIDAATAGQLTDGPILLIDGNSRTLDVVKNEVQRYTSATTVYAIGGSAVVSDEALKAVAGGKKTARLGGDDRYATSMAIAKRVLEITPSKSKKLMVARADNPIDALAAGPLDFGPLVFVGPDGELPAEVKAWVADKHVESVIGLGGKNAVPDKALSDATASVITDNPGKVNEEAIAARKAFESARALYLGVNKYQDEDGGSEFEVKGDAGESRDPRLDSVVRAKEYRFKGYKALAEEVDRRLDLVDSAVKTIKNKISNAFKDGVKQDWANFSADTTTGLGSGGQVGVALTALYGADAYGADGNDIANTEKYFIKDADGFITGVNYSAIESEGLVKKQVKSDTARIKKYFENHENGSLVSATVKGADRNGVESNNLFKSGYTIAGLAANNVGANSVFVLQKDTELFLRTAQNNADSTKLAMDQAWAKVQSGQGYTRLGGEDRYATSAMISQYMRVKTDIPASDATFRVYLANGETMADALVAGIFNNGPIILVDSAGNLTETVKNELGYIGLYKTVKGDKITYRTKDKYPTVFAIGGKNAVADATASTAASYIKAGNDKVPGAKKDLVEVYDQNVSLNGLQLDAGAATYTVELPVMVNGKTGEKTKLDNVVVVSSDTAKPSVQKVAAGDEAKIKVVLTPGTTKFGKYTIAYQYGEGADKKNYTFTYDYKLGDVVTKTDDESGAGLKYTGVLPAGYGSATVKALSADGTYDASVTDLTASTNDVTAAGSTAATKNIVAVVNGKKVVAFKAGSAVS